jgi:hypothetical protein
MNSKGVNFLLQIWYLGRTDENYHKLNLAAIAAADEDKRRLGCPP